MRVAQRALRHLLLPLTTLALGAGLASPTQAAAPLQITVYGGTGNIGQRIVHEALSRGHQVRIVVRDTTSVTEHEARLSIVQGDILDARQDAQLAVGQDVIVCAVSFRKPKPDYGGYRRAAETLVGVLRQLGAKAPHLIVVGGAGSLEVSPGVLLVDQIPVAYRGEVAGQKDALDFYRTATDVAWTYFSPARTIAPGARTGKFRLGGDRLIVDAHGDSRISMEDYAVAVLDEAEKPAHVHQRFTIGY